MVRLANTTGAATLTSLDLKAFTRKLDRLAIGEKECTE